MTGFCGGGDSDNDGHDECREALARGRRCLESVVDDLERSRAVVADLLAEVGRLERERDEALEALRVIGDTLETSRWGSCVDCRGEYPGRKILPRQCVNTDRYDHWLPPTGSRLMMILRDGVRAALKKGPADGRDE